jgi:hypothetical protein
VKQLRGFLAGIVDRDAKYQVTLWFSSNFLVVTDIKG